MTRRAQEQPGCPSPGARRQFSAFMAMNQFNQDGTTLREDTISTFKFGHAIPPLPVGDRARLALVIWVM